MARIYRDFDQQISEMKRETFTIRLFGREWEFPRAMPAIVPLEMARQEDEKTLDSKTIFNATYNIFGHDAIDEWSKHPEFTIDVLSALIKFAFEAINGKVEPEEEAVTEDDTNAAQPKN